MATPLRANDDVTVTDTGDERSSAAISVAIVDDDPIHRQYLKLLIDDLAGSHGTSYCIREFDSGFQFLEARQEAFDLILLDVAMPGLDGFATAQAIRASDDVTNIIFVTNNASAAPRGYAVAALDYLIKPVNPTELKRVLDRACERVLSSRRAASLVIQTLNGLARVSAREVRYVESRRHHILIHGRGEVITAYGAMQRVEARLQPEGFVRCHRSLLVNVRYIERVDVSDVAIAGGEMLPISRGRRRDVLDAMSTWFGQFTA